MFSRCEQISPPFEYCFVQLVRVKSGLPNFEVTWKPFDILLGFLYKNYTLFTSAKLDLLPYLGSRSNLALVKRA